MRIKSPSITHHTHTRGVLFFRFFSSFFFCRRGLRSLRSYAYAFGVFLNKFFFRRALFRATYRVATLFFFIFFEIFFLSRRALLRAMCMLLGVLLTSFFFVNRRGVLSSERCVCFWSAAQRAFFARNSFWRADRAERY